MKRYLPLPLILASLFLVTVAVAEDDATKKDQEAIQGTWRLQSRERDGKAEAADAIKDVLMTHKDNTYTFKGAKSGSGATQGTFTLDATTKPKSTDRTPADGPQKGKALLGIYELKDDTLTICVSVTGKERPTEFATKPDSGLVLAVYKREK